MAYRDEADVLRARLRETELELAAALSLRGAAGSALRAIALLAVGLACGVGTMRTATDASPRVAWALRFGESARRIAESEEPTDSQSGPSMPPSRTLAYDDTGFVPAIDLLPLVDYDRVVVWGACADATRRDLLAARAHDARTGAVLWTSCNIAPRTKAVHAGGAGAAIVVATGHELIGLRRETGQPLWRRASSDTEFTCVSPSSARWSSTIITSTARPADRCSAGYQCISDEVNDWQWALGGPRLRSKPTPVLSGVRVRTAAYGLGGTIVLGARLGAVPAAVVAKTERNSPWTRDLPVHDDEWSRDGGYDLSPNGARTDRPCTSCRTMGRRA